jgi:hypothetical protein
VIVVFAPGGTVPAVLSSIDAIMVKEYGGVKRRPAPHVRLISDEQRWRGTDFYCTVNATSAELESRAQKLGARLIFLPDRGQQFASLLIGRELDGRQSWVRVAAATDVETMLALKPLPTMELF